VISDQPRTPRQIPTTSKLSYTKRLSSGRRAAACYPSPLTGPDNDQTDENPIQRQVAVATFSEVWSPLSFKHLRERPVLDLALVTLNEAIEHLQERLVQ
jgi:hypothetical protein